MKSVGIVRDRLKGGKLDKELESAIMSIIGTPLTEEQKLSLEMISGSIEQINNVLKEKYTEACVLAVKYNRFDFIKALFSIFSFELTTLDELRKLKESTEMPPKSIPRLPSLPGMTREEHSKKKKRRVATFRSWPVLTMAVRLGRCEIFKFLVKNLGFIYSGASMYLLREAVHHGHLNIVKMMFENNMIGDHDFINDMVRVARDCVEIEVAEFLASKTYPTKTPLKYSMNWEASEEQIFELVEK